MPALPGGDAGRGRLLTSAFIALTLSDLAYFTAIGVMIPVVPLFAADRLGVGPIGVGVAVGLFSATALILRPFAGRLSDRWGSGRLLLGSAVLFTIVAAAHLLVTEYWLLLALRVALGVAEAVYFVAGIAALADVAPPDRLGEALSYNSLGLYLGIAAGPALGEWLLRTGGFQAAWIGVLCLGIVAAAFATRVPSTRQLSDESAAPPLIPRQLIGPGLAFLAGLAGAAGFLAFAALHARDVGLDGAGAVLFVYGAMVIACRLLFARLLDRIPTPWLSAWALAWCGMGLAVMTLLRIPAGLVMGAAALGVGVAFLTPAFYREMMSRLPASQRGAAAATFSIFVDLGLGGGPIVFGLITGAVGIPGAFAVGAALALLASVAMIRVGARAAQQAAQR